MRAKSTKRACVYHLHVNHVMRLRRWNNSLRKAAGASAQRRGMARRAPLLEAAATRAIHLASGTKKQNAIRATHRLAKGYQGPCYRSKMYSSIAA
jgi:hypothetical protein